jgi:hypothetical protein
MAVVHRANRKLRKEVVIPFEGEHNFIVPQYVNAAGKDATTIVKESPTNSSTPIPSTSTIPPSAGITTTPPTVVIETPNVVTTPPVVSTPQTSNIEAYQQGEIQPTGSGRPIAPAPIESPIAQPNVTTPPPRPSTVAVPTTTPVEIYEQGEIQPTGGRAPLPPPIDNPNTGTPTPPVYNASNYFPVKDYSSMSCDAITSYLADLINVDSTGWDGINAARALGDYNRTLSSVRTVKDTACRVIVPPTPPNTVTPPNPVTSPTPVVTSTTTITPPFAPVFGGGGGGGLGEQPQEQAPVVEEPKKDNSWLWILAVIGGIYFLTKKKK